MRREDENKMNSNDENTRANSTAQITHTHSTHHEREKGRRRQPAKRLLTWLVCKWVVAIIRIADGFLVHAYVLYMLVRPFKAGYYYMKLTHSLIAIKPLRFFFLVRVWLMCVSDLLSLSLSQHIYPIYITHWIRTHKKKTQSNIIQLLSLIVKRIICVPSHSFDHDIYHINYLYGVYFSFICFTLYLFLLTPFLFHCCRFYSQLVGSNNCLPKISVYS